jgi:DNA-directed RNA polymerase specialized sigma24 family protein
MNIDIDKVDFNMLIDSLPKKELEIFCLYYSPKGTLKKVGNKKGISTETVRRRLARGHRLIRRTLMLKVPEMYDHVLRTHRKRYS